MRKLFEIILKILPFLVTATLIIIILTSGNDMSVDSVLDYMPDNLFLAALVFMALYVLKSLSVIFPILSLHIAAGIIFPLWQALILNVLGTALAYTVPYLIGRFSGSDATRKLMQKYPKIRNIIISQRNNNWFPAFILRAVSCLPADIVSLYLGTIHVPYLPYVLASVVGTLPGLIPATVAGMSLTDPTSPAFIISVLASVLSSLGSIWLYQKTRKKASKKTLHKAAD